MQVKELLVELLGFQKKILYNGLNSKLDLLYNPLLTDKAQVVSE